MSSHSTSAVFRSANLTTSVWLQRRCPRPGWLPALSLAGVIVLGASAAGASKPGVVPLRSSVSSVCDGLSKSKWDMWERARFPRRRRYCDMLAVAVSSLRTKPVAAQRAVSLADRILPGKADTWVVMGSVHVQLHTDERAIHDFQRALRSDSRALHTVPALWDYAIALRRTKRWPMALAVYRRLVRRLGELSGVSARAMLLFEAATTAMALGPGHLDEAVALFRRARGLPYYDSRAAAEGWLALALSRSGEQGISDRLIQQLVARKQLDSVLRGLIGSDGALHVADTRDIMALRALLQESSKPALAAKHWAAFLRKAPKSPFAPHAKQRLKALRQHVAHPHHR